MTRQEAFQLLVKLCAHSVPIPNGATVQVCDERGNGTKMSDAGRGRLLVVPQGVFGAFVDWLAEEVAQVTWVKESMAASAPAGLRPMNNVDCAVEGCTRDSCDGCPDYESGVGKEVPESDNYYPESFRPAEEDPPSPTLGDCHAPAVRRIPDGKEGNRG